MPLANQNTMVIIPALNEAQSIGRVIGDIPRGLVRETVVVDNGSTDETPEIARACGATVLYEPRRGYGWACMKGIEYARTKDDGERPHVVVFLDGDYSDFPEEIEALLKPIIQGGYDFVVGSRMLGRREKGAMPMHAILGNLLATTLIRLLYGARFTDLGPMRAIKLEKLLALGMEDRTFGWTAEMQVKAAKTGFKWTEVPVSYRKRVGSSKVTGTLGGTIKAGCKIIWAILKHL